MKGESRLPRGVWADPPSNKGIKEETRCSERHNVAMPEGDNASFWFSLQPCLINSATPMISRVDPPDRILKLTKLRTSRMKAPGLEDSVPLAPF